jgi:hypothetical protein
MPVVFASYRAQLIVRSGRVAKSGVLDLPRGEIAVCG